ncbi:MAG: DsbE family thiol:disulfide interchange protein [Rhodobiaceae bacterium]|jgi:cytochrome c biogenesis protein CcmG/thiol:disulfide interchange protein DsbE|nr:DsbE family thiol:disulfide interchange protein [Rhodobiaceae bacterium]MBT7279098.1 DsbE family thiol:disulfide interchange protein [Rhodobiaceae bacterium]MDG2495776.1 DsbE family thiol:disulfide interchange protein [Alphaproteobacteria bacterium]
MSELRETQSSLWRFAPLAMALALAGVFFIGLFLGDPTRLPSAYEGKTLPAFSLAGLTEGGGFSNADLAQGRPVLINVWASWCGPCREEHPALMQLATQGVPIFGLNYKDNPAAARRFLGRLGNPYMAIGTDTNGRVALDLGVYGVPETFVLDGQARVLYRHVGPLDDVSLMTKILPYFLTP